MRESLIFLEPYIPAMESLHAVHDPAYLEAFREAAARGDRHFAVRDCAISEGSYEAALLAAGGVMAGIDAVLSGRSDNVFCAVRPPGHHAGRSSAMGFCFVNNVAAGARYARSAYGVERIYILDWDVHHGNGTQALFDEDPLTFFCSLHEHPSFCYPGTGRRLERGRGPGLGTTLNVPLAPHAGDREMIEAFEREVVPSIEAFRPELILLSAGFDAHRDDPIAGLECTEDAYVHMTRRVLELADRHCEGRVVSVLEGGYRTGVAGFLGDRSYKNIAGKGGFAMFVGPRMKRDLVTVTPGATLEAAARLLTAHRIHHLPVVEEGNRLAGIVSDTDLRNATLDGMFGGADRGDSGRPVTVGEIMTRELVTLSPGDTLDDAMLVLTRQRIGALPVVEGDRLVGIVTKADILSALLSTLDIEGLGVRIEVVLRRDVKEVARLVAALADQDVEVRSLVLALHGADRYAAFVRVATIDVASVRDRLRAKGFAVGELSDFYEGG